MSIGTRSRCVSSHLESSGPGARVMASSVTSFLSPRGDYRLAGAAKELFVLPLPAGPGLACHHQVQAGHEGDQLSSRTRLEPRVLGDAPAALATHRGEFPPVRETVGLELEPHLQPL